MAASTDAQPTVSDALERRLGWLMALLAFLFFRLQAPSFSVPGRWAEMLASFSGLDASRLPLRPLWSGLMSALAALPLPDLPAAAHTASALAGAGIVGLLYAIVRRLPIERSRQWRARDEAHRWPRLIAGLAAALFVMTSSPVITAATRGDYALTGPLLLLAALYPSALYLRRPQPALLFVSCLLYGLGLAEYPVLAAMLPAFALWWAALLWMDGSRAWGRFWTALSLSLFVALTMAFAFALILADTPSAQYRGWDSIGLTLLEYGRYYFSELTRSVPRVGWLAVFFTSLLPFLLVMFRELHTPNDLFGRLGAWAFRLVLIALAIVTLFDLPGSPARVAGSRTLLVAPHLLTAAWFAVLLASFLRALQHYRSSVPRALLLTALIALFTAAGVQHVRSTSPSRLAPVAAFAREVAGQLDSETWLITDGTLDASLRLAARAGRRPLHLLTEEASTSPFRSRYHASLFESPALKSMASAGVRPLLLEWIRIEPAIAGKLALLTGPGLLDIDGYTLVPDRLVFRLVPAGTEPDAAALLARHEGFWEARAANAPVIPPFGEAGWLQSFFTARWGSRVANDAGVYLENRGDTTAAQRAYRFALAWWPDNLSATLNLLAEARRTSQPEEASLKAQLDAQLERVQRIFNPRYAPQLCGTIRSAAASLEEAEALGRSGQQRLALARLQQAGSLMEDDSNNTAARLGLARLYLESGNAGESAAIFQDILASTPNDVPALTGMLRIALRQQDWTAAASWIDRLAAAGLEARLVAFERARLDLQAGRVEQAREQFLALSRQTTVSIETWYHLALISFQQRDQELLERAAPALEADRYYRPGLLLLGEIAMRGGDLERARSSFEQALALDPVSRHALERLIQLHYAARDAAGLQVRASALLALDPNSALAHFGLANVHLANGQLDLAEAAFRRTLAAKDIGQARNDLAWILGERGQLDEALEHALRAIELQGDNANTWDTLAGIHHKRGEKDAAEKAIAKAITLADGRAPGILIRATQLYRDMGRIEEASQTLDLLQGMRSILPPDRLREVDALRR